MTKDRICCRKIELNESQRNYKIRIRKKMSEDQKITRLMLIKPEDENNKYVVEESSLLDSMSSGDDLPAVGFTSGSPAFCYIRVNTKIYSAPLSYHLMYDDFFGYLDALKIVSVRHRDTWEGACDDILTDAEKRKHRYESSYPGLIAFFEQSVSYNGDWNEYLPPL